MTIELHIPRLKEMEVRQAWLSDPATMAYNRGRDLDGAEGYDPETGCIDFSRENWRYWRQVWLMNEPDFYTAYIRDAERDAFVGEVCWFREGENDYTAGILISAEYRGQGYCAPALRALAEHAFARDDIPALRCPLPTDNPAAVKGFARAGFIPFGEQDGMLLMNLPREIWERERIEWSVE